MPSRGRGLSSRARTCAFGAAAGSDGYQWALAVSTLLRNILFWCALAVFGLATCWALHLITLTKFIPVANEPLRHPIRVQQVNGTNLVLENGKIIGLNSMFSDISNQLLHSDFEVDVERGDTNGPGFLEIQAGNTNRVDIYARRPSKSDFIRPLSLTIPLIRRTTGTNHRVWVAYGEYVATSSQPHPGTDPNRPF